MTLTSFIGTRPPAPRGVAMTPMWTTVSTASSRITRPTTGLRMSARTNATSPSDVGGGTTSTPTTRRTSGHAAREDATLPPRCRDTPVTRTVRPLTPMTVGADYFLLRRWCRVRRSSLRCFFFAMRLRRFLMTEPTWVLR